jgi:hypothetical protein
MRRRPLPSVDFSRLNTHSLHDRPSKVQVADLGRVVDRSATVDQLFESLPNQLAGVQLRRWRDVLLSAVAADRHVVAAIGGHVIKTGCGPHLIDWIKRGVLTAIAMNGSAAIHDVELALAGRTSEDVDSRLPNGSFGMTRETAEFFGIAAEHASDRNMGLGQALGELLHTGGCRHSEASLVHAAVSAGIPCTVHVALGTDIVHMHSCCSGAKTGDASMRDFRTLCQVVADLQNGVWMNLGSAVVMPEVFLKAVSIARNLGYNLDGMTTVDLDMIRQYRSRVNVLERHRSNGFSITGHHEIILPLIHAAVIARLDSSAPRPANEGN